MRTPNRNEKKKAKKETKATCMSVSELISLDVHVRERDRLTSKWK